MIQSVLTFKVLPELNVTYSWLLVNKPTDIIIKKCLNNTLSSSPGNVANSTSTLSNDSTSYH